MKFRKTGRALVAAAALTMALGMTACSSGDDTGNGGKSTTAAEQSANAAPLPTADELNEALKSALSGEGDESEHAEWLEGAEDDPDLIPNLVTSAKESGAEIDLTDVTDTGTVDGKATAQASGTWTINGQENPLTVPLIYLDGHWKVSKEWTCTMLQANNMTSPICDAA